MLVIAVLGIVVAVNIIMEFCEPKIYYEGLIFFKVIYNSNGFSDVFDFPSQTFCWAVHGLLQYPMEILAGKYESICEHLFKGYFLSEASLDNSRKH